MDYVCYVIGQIVGFQAKRFLSFGSSSYLRQLFRNLFHKQGFTYDYVFDWNMLKFGGPRQDTGGEGAVGHPAEKDLRKHRHNAARAVIPHMGNSNNSNNHHGSGNNNTGGGHSDVIAGGGGGGGTGGAAAAKLHMAPPEAPPFGSASATHQTQMVSANSLVCSHGGHTSR